MQPSLFNFLEDEVGELDEEQKLFVRVAESLELRQIAARYGWCGKGRKPSSRLAIFKLLLMKHVWNCPETKDALGEVREVTGGWRYPARQEVAFHKHPRRTHFQVKQ